MDAEAGKASGIDQKRFKALAETLRGRTVVLGVSGSIGDRFAVVIGDVTGHGIEASITAFQAKYLLRVFLDYFRDPAQALGELNAQLSVHGRAESPVRRYRSHRTRRCSGTEGVRKRCVKTTIRRTTRSREGHSGGPMGRGFLPTGWARGSDVEERAHGQHKSRSAKSALLRVVLHKGRRHRVRFVAA